MDGLCVRRDGIYLDGTFGRGGHARGVLERLGPTGRLLVMDKDPVAMASAAELASEDARVAAFRGSFAELANHESTIQKNGISGRERHVRCRPRW